MEEIQFPNDASVCSYWNTRQEMCSLFYACDVAFFKTFHISFQPILLFPVIVISLLYRPQLKNDSKATETISFFIFKVISFMKHMLIMCMVFHTFRSLSVTPKLLPVVP
jgi:hypothetical protein